jgi:hypothetical protein
VKILVVFELWPHTGDLPVYQNIPLAVAEKVGCLDGVTLSIGVIRKVIVGKQVAVNVSWGV